ncbi:transposase [Wukongibacter baidiensis]|uniref:transposase n=1 Tax=Wukongibacter baidiensis TaxID=1723361 RepID=UPI003D7F71BB
MARKLRVHYEGALYHVIVRGNNRSLIFMEPKWKNAYLEIVKRYKEKYDFKLYAYSIMDNHAHLLIEVGKTELSRIMKCIQQVYTQKYNRELKRSGHVFEQRYKAFICDKDSYLLSLVRYIHQNPLKAGLTKSLSYEWSSHDEYLEIKEPLVDKNYILEILSTNHKKAINIYLKRMELDESLEPNDYELNEEERILKESKQESNNKNTIEFEELVNSICDQEDIEIKDIRKRSRVKTLSDLRKAIVLLSEKYCELSNKKVADTLKLNPSMVSKIKNDAVAINEEVISIMERYENK